MSESQKGKVISEETRKKLSESQKGKRTLTPEQIQKLVKARHSPENEKPFTDEHKKHLSLALKGKKRSDEFKKKISLAVKGRKLSDEHKRNISEAHKKRHANKEISSSCLNC